MNRLRVLLLDSGRQALPFLKSLRLAGHHVTVACGARLSEAYLSRYANARLLWPDYFKDAAGFTDRLMEYLRAQRPDVTLSVGDVSAGILARNKAEVIRYTRVTVPNLEIFDQAADKANTMAFCMANDIPCPRTYPMYDGDVEPILDGLQFPVMVKPRRGIGAIGVHRFDDADSLRRHFTHMREHHGELLVQEFIPLTGGMQFQAEAFLDSDSRMKVCMVILKPRFFPVTGGTSTANLTIDRPDIQQSVRRLLEGLRWVGPADVDLILDPRDNVPKILEINPRVTAGIKIGFAAGIDYADLHLRLAMGEPIPEIGSYRLGVYCRNLIMDMLWYLFSDRHSRKATPLPFFKFCGRDVYDQTFAIDDPLPSVGFALAMIKKYSNPSTWANKLGTNIDLPRARNKCAQR